jgi:class 3 adenylate cyclase/DNA-binding CsgD family transcriptional regulator
MARQRPTRRQSEVLRAYLRAGSVPAAAYELGISETTVRQHLSGMYRRTGYLNAAEAAYWLGAGDAASSGPGCPTRQPPAAPSLCSVRRTLRLPRRGGRDPPRPALWSSAARGPDGRLARSGRYSPRMRPPERGAQRPWSLAFIDRELEARYQAAAGQEGLGGFRMIALASAVLWAAAAFLLPEATDLKPEMTIAVGLSMSVLGSVIVLLSRWALTLDRQHALVMLLTSANGVVILALAVVAGVLPGYGVAAMMLLLAWGAVARTRFIYAGIRTAAMGAAFMVALVLYPGADDLALDVFLFAAAAAGSLLGLRILERNRRRLFVQDVVIREQGDRLAEEMDKSERLILNMLPQPVASRLLDGELTIADDYPSVTVLFADIVGFTPLAARLSAHDVVGLLNQLFSAFDTLVAQRGVEKIKTIGDAYMAVAGIGDPGRDDAERVVSLGCDMLEEAARHVVLGQPLRLRIGVHSGQAVGGVIGSRKLAFDLWGDTVNVASRLQAQADPGRVHISEATWLHVNDLFEFEAQGERQLRGHAPMRTYAVIGPALARAG